jgi:hypothetical protein
MPPSIPGRGPTRRTVLTGLSLAPFAGLLTDAAVAQAATGPYRFFDAHQAAVIDAATRRLVPGPEDDPTERGHPGAHEADVVRYIDTVLAAFTFATPKVHAGGPWSNRHAPGPDYMATFVPLDRAQDVGWRIRISELQQAYLTGIEELDAAAGGDFTTVSTTKQDQILEKSPFTPQLFTNTIEGMYSVPEYGGNANLVGWTDNSYPGDVQPVGYTPAEVTNSDGIDVVEQSYIVGLVLSYLPTAAEAMIAVRTNRRG